MSKIDPVYVLGRSCLFIGDSYGERSWSSDEPCRVRVTHSGNGDYWSVAVHSGGRMLIFAMKPTLLATVEAADREWSELVRAVNELEAIRARRVAEHDLVCFCADVCLPYPAEPGDEV